jgi:DNA-binding MurR/RpiR family transcriptional regulator
VTAARATIKAHYGSLPAAQQKVADYMLAHSEDAPFLSVHDLAEAAGASVASVSRFTRRIGFKNYKQLREDLARDAWPTLETVYEAIDPGDSDAQIIRKAFSGNVRSLQETLKLVSHRDLTKAATAIASARRVLFLGIGSSGYIAGDAALRFSQLDLQAEAASDAYGMLNRALGLTRGDVAFGISHSGRSAITVEAIRLAVQCGARSIAMSNYLQSPLHDVCGLFLCTSFPESRVKVAALSSRVAQTGLMDALYLLVARHAAPARMAKAEALNTVTERLLRKSSR